MIGSLNLRNFSKVLIRSFACRGLKPLLGLGLPRVGCPSQLSGLAYLVAQIALMKSNITFSAQSFGSWPGRHCIFLSSILALSTGCALLNALLTNFVCLPTRTSYIIRSKMTESVLIAMARLSLHSLFRARAPTFPELYGLLFEGVMVLLPCA